MSDASTENETTTEERETPTPVIAVRAAWRSQLQRWRRVARIQFARAVLHCLFSLRQFRRGDASAVVKTIHSLRLASRQFRKRPVTSVTALVVILAGGYYFYSERGDSELPSTSGDQQVVLDDVKVFPPQQSPATSLQPAPEKSPARFEPGFHVAKSVSPKPIEKTGPGPRLLGPQFPDEAKAVTSTQTRNHQPDPQPIRTQRAVWFTGTVEDPETDTTRLRPIAHSRPSQRYARSQPSPFPPRR